MPPHTAEVVLRAAFDRIAALEGAIAAFLEAEGNDLCHENRQALAAALGIYVARPPLPAVRTVPRCEFERRCREYADSIYPKEAAGD